MSKKKKIPQIPPAETLLQGNPTVTDNSVTVARISVMGTVITAFVGGIFLLISSLISKDKPSTTNNYNLYISTGNTTQKIKMEKFNTASIKDTIDKIITNPQYNSVK